MTTPDRPSLLLSSTCPCATRASRARVASRSRVNAGGHLALLGASGAGKSTLLRTLGGLDTPCHGRVLLGGIAASEAGHVLVAPHRRGVAMVFRTSPSGRGHAVRQRRPGSRGRRPSSRAEAEARAHAGRCRSAGSPASAKRDLASLSGGERQRVALARALATRPSLLLLDEPFASLDVLTKARLLEEVRLLARSHAITLVVVSHDRREVEALCVNGAVLEGGRLVEAGFLGMLSRQSRSDFGRAFFGDAPPELRDRPPAAVRRRLAAGLRDRPLRVRSQALRPPSAWPPESQHEVQRRDGEKSAAPRDP